jgi:hypothetical protein
MIENSKPQNATTVKEYILRLNAKDAEVIKVVRAKMESVWKKT